MLLQLECCDLEICDFEECKIVEYNWEEDYWEDIAEANADETKTRDGMEKGIIIEYYDHLMKKKDYKYPPLGLPKKELLDWVDAATQEIADTDVWAMNNVIHWKLDVYSCVRVLRDRLWWINKYPIMEAFWKDVLFYRTMGIEKLRADFNKKERKPRVKKEVPVNFLSDTESEGKPKRAKKSAAKRKVIKKQSTTPQSNSKPEPNIPVTMRLLVVFPTHVFCLQLDGHDTLSDLKEQLGLEAKHFYFIWKAKRLGRMQDKCALNACQITSGSKLWIVQKENNDNGDLRR